MRETGSSADSGAHAFLVTGAPPPPPPPNPASSKKQYRAENGTWKITTDQSNIPMNHGVVRSLGEADLPVEAGLKWYPADVKVSPHPL